MELRKLIRKLYGIYPLSLAEAWDFSGYQAGRIFPGREVRRVLLTLDYAKESLDMVRKERPELVLTHHPFFFGKKGEVKAREPWKEELEQELLRQESVLYSFHTNFDKAQGGMNDTLLSFLPDVKEVTLAQDGLMRIATLKEPLPLEAFALLLKKAFSLPYVRVGAYGRKVVSRFGFIAGGASKLFPEALSLGLDAYVSGDCTQPTRLLLREAGMSYVEISHEVEEKGFLAGMRKTLLSLDPGLSVLCLPFEEDFKVLS